MAEDEVVGSIGLIDIGNNCGVIRKMFVRHSHRGGKGVSSNLLRRLIE